MYSRQMEINVSLLNLINDFMQQGQLTATEMDAALNSVALKIKDAMMQEYLIGVQEMLQQSTEQTKELAEEIEKRVDKFEEEVTK